MTVPRQQLAPWVFVLAFGGVVSLALVLLRAYSLDTFVWLLTHPEAFAGALAVAARAVGKGVSKLPHFRNGTPERELDAARLALYSQVLRASDTLTAVQAELDSLYARVMKLRSSLPGG
jgi:hypothetical protein